MPELPEVETIKRELEKAVLGKKITGVIVNNPKVIREPRKEDFVKGLRGAAIKNILRKGKLLILELSSGKSLAIHLKMTGQLVLRPPLKTSPERATCGERSRTKRVEGLIYPGNAKTSRVSFKLSDGKILDFNDQRLFAEMRLINDWTKLPFIQGLGPEPFDLSADEFKQMLSNKKTKIKPLLLEQTFISGVGNLYAAEALFGAKIHPGRSANSLSDKELELLLKKIKDTLKQAIQHQGSSIDQYVQLNGSPGRYVKHLKVYDREGKPCLVCKATIKRINLGGRGTYFCPKCQR